MAKSTFEPYWVIASVGEPISFIGSGLRRVHVSIGRKWVKVRGAGQTSAHRISMKAWDSLEKTPDYGQDLGTILHEIRPSKGKRTCTLQPVI